MLQVSSKHFETTSANYRIDLTLIGLQAEHCTAAAANARLGPIAASDIYDEHPLFPYNSNISSGPLSTRGLCAEGVSILSTGLVGLQGVHNSSGVPSVSCGLIDTDGSDYYPHEHQQEVRSLDDAAACAVTLSVLNAWSTRRMPSQSSSSRYRVGLRWRMVSLGRRGSNGPSMEAYLDRRGSLELSPRQREECCAVRSRR